MIQILLVLSLLALTVGPAGAQLGTGQMISPANPWMHVGAPDIRTVPGITNVRFPDGTAALPAQTYIADPDLGSYRIGANNEGFSAGGTLRWDYNTARISTTIPIYLPAGSASAPALAFAVESGTGFFRPTANTIDFADESDGAAVFRMNNGGIVIHAVNTLGWGSSGVSSPDIFLYRGAADILEQRRGTNAQESRIENTFTDTSNREFVSLGFKNNADVFTIQTEAAGTGTVRNIGVAGGQVGIATTLTIGSITPLTINTGGLGFTTVTAAASAPGAAGGKLEWRCGTNAGTIRAVAYGGTSSTGVTVVDNVGAGVTGC